MDVLAASTGTPCQAFTAGSNALGLQFHAEFDAARIEEWLSGHAVELAHAGIDLDALRRDTVRHGAALAQAGSTILERWLDELDLERLTKPPWLRCIVSPYRSTVFADAPCPEGFVRRS
jgi:hypothetical protein